LAGIREIQQRQAQWQEEKPEGQGLNYFPRAGDIVFFYFMSTGEDQDPFMDVFWSHEIPAQQQGGWPTLKYCPAESGIDHSYQCQHCLAGIKVKKRMMVWMYVQEVLHTILRQGENLPTVNYMGRNYFRREINDVRLWDTSAWRESPLDDILFLGQQTGNLHAQQFTLHVSGERLDRRYKIYVQQGSQGFPRELFEGSKPKCKPVLEILREQIAQVATEERPAAANVAASPEPVTQAYTPPSAAAPPWAQGQEPVPAEQPVAAPAVPATSQPEASPTPATETSAKPEHERLF